MELVSETWEKDEYGVSQRVLTVRQVYCSVSSVTQLEFFEAGRNGLNPQYRFTMFAGDYADERVVRYHGQDYGVYRAYQTRTDSIELYCERKGGTNGSS